MEVDWRNLRFLKFERESVCSKIRERERERERVLTCGVGKK